MNKSSGIFMVAYGPEYYRTAMHTICASRRHLYNLTWCLFTDQKPEKNDFPDNVIVKYYPVEHNMHREIKIDMARHSPFDYTIYMDADAVVRKAGLSYILRSLDQGWDMALNVFDYWRAGQKIPQIYAQTMRLAKCTLPITIYNAGFILFKGSPAMQKFCTLWNFYWNEMGCGREMPAFNCALQQSDLRIKPLPRGRHKVFEPDIYDANALVQHNYNSNGGMNWFEEFGIPPFQTYKPFDKHTDWNFVDYEKST